jgi:diacylglycerol kinase family enzyme
MVTSARVAMMRDLHHIDVRVRAGGPPQHAVLLCNPRSGGGKVERFGLVDLAAQLGVETVLLDDGLDLEQLARDAIARGADCLGMAGGDGSQALVASIAVEHDLPFVCISAGTRNHFALDLGLNRDDPRETMQAFRDAVERRVDYATVNGRLFVNNVSLGVYAQIVQEDSYRDAKAETAATVVRDTLGKQSEPFDLQFTTPSGQEVDGAILVMISNNPYVLGASPDNAQRRRLDAGTLGVFAVTTNTGAEAALLVAASAVGQRRRSPFWQEFTTTSFEVQSRSGTAYAGVDGEALELDTPLTFEIHPRGLTLLVPEGNIKIAEARQARDVTIPNLLALATGHDPRRPR